MKNKILKVFRSNFCRVSSEALRSNGILLMLRARPTSQNVARALIFTEADARGGLGPTHIVAIIEVQRAHQTLICGQELRTT